MRSQGSEGIINYELQGLCSVSFVPAPFPDADAKQTVSVLDLPRTDPNYDPPKWFVWIFLESYDRMERTDVKLS